MPRRVGNRLIAGVLGVIALGSFCTYQVIARRMERAAQDLLEATAELKQQQVVDHLDDQLDDASLLATRPSVVDGILAEAGGASTARTHAALLRSLQETRRTYGYHAVVAFDTAGTPVETDGHTALEGAARDRVRDAVASGMALNVPAHQGADHVAEYGIVVPCRTDEGRVCGAVYVSYDAVETLRPLLAPLPGSEPSTESLLLERDGDDLVVVDAPITGADLAPLSHRIPLNDVGYVAPILFHASDGGPVVGLDYRGRRVIAAGRRVPNTPYLIVAKIDEAEVWAPIHRVGWGVLASALLLIGLVAAGFRNLQITAEREGERRELLPLVRYVSATQTLTDAFALIARDGHLLDVNAALERMSGYPRAALIGSSVLDLEADLAADALRGALDRVAKAGGARFPSRIRRRSGEILDLEVTAAFVGTNETGEYYAFGRDVTEELARSRNLERQNQQYAFLSRVSETLFDHASEQGAFEAVCRLAVSVGGFTLVWVGRLDAQGSGVRPVAWAGAMADADALALVTLDADAGAGSALAARAIREGQRLVLGDPTTDPTSEAWRAVAREHALATAAALPIVAGGEAPLAALVVHSTTSGLFSPVLMEILAQIARLLGLVARATEVARTRDEEAARRIESERRYQDLFESSPMAMNVIDERTGRFARVNRAFTELFGYTLADMPTFVAAMDQMYADPVRRIEVSEGWARDIARVVDGAPPIASPELTLRSKSGEARVVQGFVSRIGHELVTGWVDLTRLRATDELLREAEQIARLGSWGFDFRTGEMTRSASLVAMVRETLSAPRTQIVPPTDLLARDVQEEALQALRRAAAAHEPFDHLITMPSATGSPRFLRSRARIDYGADGAPLRAVGSAQDVTAEVEARRELERSRDQLEQRVKERTAALTEAYAQVKASDDRFQHAVEAAAEGVWDWDVDTGTMHVNTMFSAMLGYAPDEMELSLDGLHALLHPDDRARTFAEVERRMREEGGYALEFRLRAKDGSYRWILSHGKVVERDTQGEPRRVVGTHLDLTARRETEDALRTAQLAADRANRAKSAFLANMSHEIRTPLNAIIGLTHLLRRDALEPAQLTRLGKIDGAAQHLLAVINDILDLSKIEAGKLTTEAIDLDVRRLVDDTCDAVQAMASVRGLTLGRWVDPAIPRALVGDPVRVRQLLFNLASNAVKFTEVGSVTVEARVVGGAAGRVRVRFEVRDTGIGLSAEAHGRLFAPFEQADSSTTRKYGGTGLGLALCKRLVELLDGSIDVISEPGVGSTFWFELPLQRGAEPTSSVALPVAALRIGDGASPRRSARILVVDDDAINREVAVELLRAAGYRVDAAEDGKAAVQRASTETYDLVLMDMQMPVLDGVAATEALRAQPHGARVPVVALTANVFSDDRARCLAAGMNDFLAKPLDPSTLLATVARWVGPGASTGHDANAGADGLPPAITAIVGLDTANGVRRVGGSWPTYERLLRRYAVERRGDVAGLEAHLREGRREDAERAAHTLKGTSGTLGAEAVRVAAEAVERAIREGRSSDELAAPLSTLRAVHQRLMEQLLVAFPPAPDAADVTVDWAQARGVVSRLLALLAEDNAEAVLVMRAHGPLLQAALGGAARELTQRVDRYEFDVGLSLLRQAASSRVELGSLP